MDKFIEEICANVFNLLFFKEQYPKVFVTDSSCCGSEVLNIYYHVGKFPEKSP